MMSQIHNSCLGYKIVFIPSAFFQALLWLGFHICEISDWWKPMSAGANQTIQKAHSNFEHVLPNNIKASFFWAPYTENMTSVLSEWWAPL